MRLQPSPDQAACATVDNFPVVPPPITAIWKHLSSKLLAIYCLCWLCSPTTHSIVSLLCARVPPSLSRCRTWASLCMQRDQGSPHAKETLSRRFWKGIDHPACTCVCVNSLTNEQGFLNEEFCVSISFKRACFTELFSYDWVLSSKTNPKGMEGVWMKSLINYVGYGTPHTTFGGAFQEWFLASV